MVPEVSVPGQLVLKHECQRKPAQLMAAREQKKHGRTREDAAGDQTESPRAPPVNYPAPQRLA